MTLQKLLETTKIEEHFWIAGKLFEIRRERNFYGHWTNLGLYHIDRGNAIQINVYFLDSYVLYCENPRLRLENDIQENITRYIRFGHRVGY